MINKSAYDAWMFRIRPDNPADLNGLLDAAGYRTLVESESH
jgi:glycine cleavage system H protein